MLKLVDDHLELLPWITQTGLDVNPVPAGAFISSLLPGGILKVTNVSSKAFGGALVALKRPVPALGSASLPYLGLDMDVYVSRYDLALLGRLEIDWKEVQTGAPNAATEIENVFNFSSQLNLSTGQWQIDTDPSSWVDTGFKPTVIADKWTHFAMRCFEDLPNNQFSVLSVSWDGVKFMVPAKLQKLTCQPSNWQRVAAIQLQTETMTPGGLTTLYRNIETTRCDQPF